MSMMGKESNQNSATKHVSNFVDVFDKQYYNINKRLLCFVGLWPYQTVFERAVRSGVMVMISYTLIGPQVGFVTALNLTKL